MTPRVTPLAGGYRIGTAVHIGCPRPPRRRGRRMPRRAGLRRVFLGAGLRRRSPSAGPDRIRPDGRRNPRVRPAHSQRCRRETAARNANDGDNGPAGFGTRHVAAAAASRRGGVRSRAQGLRAAADSRRPRASRMVGPGNARHVVAAHRADDALLAQPFRVGAAEGADRAPHVPAERHAASLRARQASEPSCTRSPRTRR